MLDEFRLHWLDEARFCRREIRQRRISEWVGWIRSCAGGLNRFYLIFVFFFKRGVSGRFRNSRFERIFFIHTIGLPFRVTRRSNLFHRPPSLDRLIVALF